MAGSDAVENVPREPRDSLEGRGVCGRFRTLSRDQADSLWRYLGGAARADYSRFAIEDRVVPSALL